MRNSAVNGLDGLLCSDEALTHFFRVPTFVFACQRLGESATVLNSSYLVR